MSVMSENGQYINDINDKTSFLAIPITQAQLFKYSFAKNRELHWHDGYHYYRESWQKL